MPRDEVLGLIETPMSSNIGHTNESQEGTLLVTHHIVGAEHIGDYP